ncbi:MAG TPA: single-stranded DNA-binding protein [Bacillota bacterium]|jgi:single-strand DNA-binding protein|nr:single-stranded DNA-binding protein [Bacillota bacterium]HOA91577.1 single-stranded DNA-binding protein [Bacillota bacterium]HOP53572.1 single-stranded DNA-binding protein [Bacillota bacterium]HPT60882.1 single-stranded DNA-binding protein [Bacillota bacterium]HPZ73578.1 single-stranded DNA-binding protein [Bacillota bacterium]
MLNRVILIGRLTRDPELRYTTTGNAQARFTLAVDRDFTNQQGEREADFIPVVAWGKLGEIVAHNLVKGRLVAVEGRISVRSYEAKDGTRRWVTDVNADTVKFLEPKGGYSGSKNDSSFGDYDDSLESSGDEGLDEVPF